MRVSDFDLDLAERYRDVLREIKELNADLNNWGEGDIELAERYVSALQSIRELTNETEWSESDVELAERYATALSEADRLK